ncbi:MAG: hypothetical protein QOE90_1817 [Thermoplasmata archaeon]|nr:hypothetical protein [Thermoplasmata archaeon]
MRSLILIGLVSLALVVPAALAGGVFESAGVGSYNSGKCSSTTNGYQYNVASAGGGVAPKSVGVQGGNVCNLYHSAFYNYDYTSVFTGVYVYDSSTNGYQYVQLDWTTINGNCETTATAQTDVVSDSAPLGCPVGNPPVISGLLP